MRATVKHNLYKLCLIILIIMEKRWWFLLFLIPLLYRPIFGIIFVFFLPGYAIVMNLFKNSRFHQKFAFSLILSLCILVINGFLINMTFGFSFATVLISLLMIIGIPSFIYYKRNPEYKVSSFLLPDKTKIFKIILLLFCLGILAGKVYSPHFESRYPIHVDEWYRLIGTTYLMEEGKFEGNIPTAQLPDQPPGRIRMNPGFYFVLSQFYYISGVDNVLFFQYLPALFAVFTAIIIFSFLAKISSYWTGLFAILFMSFMKTNENTLGISFLVALTMTFPLLYGIFYALYNGFEEKNSVYFLIASMAYFSVLVTHEQTGAAFFPIIFLFLLVDGIVTIIKHKKFYLTKEKLIVLIVALIIPVFAVYVARGLLWKGNFAESLSHFLNLIVWPGDNIINYPYNFILFYGPVLTILAVIGFFAVIANFKMIVFFIWTLIATGQVINFYFNDFTLFSYIPRVRHHAVLGLIPLSAYGFYFVLDLIIKKIEKLKEYHAMEAISVVLIIIISISSWAVVDTGDYFPDDKRPLNQQLIFYTLDDKDYQAISHLKSISSGKIVLTEPDPAMAIYPISKNFVIASSESANGVGNMEAVNKFFGTPSCEKKQAILSDNNVDYVISKKPFNCNFLKQVYTENFRYMYIYEVISK